MGAIPCDPELMPWTPYADTIYAVLSTAGLLLCVWLVLRPGRSG